MATVNSSSSSPSACPDKAAVKPARYCLCAPTTHPGSFRCRLHRPKAENAPAPPSGPDQAAKEAAVADKEAAAAAAARALLARVARTSRKNGGRVKGFEPAPSRLRIMDG
uniref:Uncharacterized protein n=1 Tax=Avena sativa TaxID=4498 RepID=A0ACD5YNH2_AVESA